MNQYSKITIKDSLTYNTIKPIMNNISGVFDKVKLIKCENICEIDITGIQFLIAARKHSTKIEVINNMSEDVSEFIKKLGYSNY